MKTRTWVVVASLGVATFPHAVLAQEQFTGDTKLACEAILCLSTGQRPDQCTPSIQRYFSISYRRFSDTIRGRINFLNQCPKGGDAQMNTLVQAIASGAGSCDAATLNATLQYWPEDSNSPVIANSMPDHCAAYYTHPYTNLTALAPVYAGDRWVPPAEYAAAMADYKARSEAAGLTAATAGNE